MPGKAVNDNKAGYSMEVCISLFLLVCFASYTLIFLAIRFSFVDDPGGRKAFDLYTITQPMYVGFWILAPFTLYFFPTLVALVQRSLSGEIKWIVFKKNILFGWTAIGWLNCWKIILNN